MLHLTTYLYNSDKLFALPQSLSTSSDTLPAPPYTGDPHASDTCSYSPQPGGDAWSTCSVLSDIVAFFSASETDPECLPSLHHSFVCPEQTASTAL